MSSHKVIGLMSGTSLDGLDICYANFKFDGNYWRFKVLKTNTIPYSPFWKEKLASAPLLSGINLLLLDKEYAVYLSDMVNAFIKMHNIQELDLISSHGHTVFHEPSKGFGFQLGNNQLLSIKTAKTLVCDFRKQDLLMGGQGAPLVPLGDDLLFSEYEYCVNLGGFANISFMDNNERRAQDICPVNIVMNALCEKVSKVFDENGEMARKGKVDEGLLQKLNELVFYKTKPPKSLSLEWVQENIYPLINERKDISNLLATFVEHSSYQISIIFSKPGKVLFTGGGVYNQFLMDKIALKSPNIKVVIPDDDLVNFKEALIFGFLGLLKYLGRVNVYKSVTGSLSDHGSGIIYKTVGY